LKCIAFFLCGGLNRDFSKIYKIGRIFVLGILGVLGNWELSEPGFLQDLQDLGDFLWWGSLGMQQPKAAA
jgi:hypothetical protein